MGRLPGDSMVPMPFSPLLPAAKTAKMPAACRASMSPKNVTSPPFVLPQELLTMSGALLGSGLFPDRSVGARTHWKP